MLVQYDADKIAYMVSYGLEGVNHATSLVKSVLSKTMNKYYKLAVTVGAVSDQLVFINALDRSNYRFTVYPDYKAARVGQSRPSYFYEVREKLIDCHGAEIVSNMETDDRLSINVWSAISAAKACGKKKTLILTFSEDKDLRIVPELHNEMRDEYIYYSDWPGHLRRWRSGKAIKYFGTGLKWFHYQMLIGDEATDGIPPLILDKSPIKEARAFDLINTMEWTSIMNLLLQHNTTTRINTQGQLLWLKRFDDEPLWTYDDHQFEEEL